MEDKILTEIKQVRHLLSALIGTSDLPSDQRFSKEAIDKAASEFQKMSIERGEWLPEDEIHKVIRHAPYSCGNLIIEKFGFINYFKRGRTLYFKKRDLIELNKELKERNINLEKYAQLVADQEKFEELVRSINLPKGKKTRQYYKIPEGLRDIHSKPFSPALEEQITQEIDSLLEEYKKFDLSEYVEFYEKKTQAYFRYQYSLDRYLKSDLKKYCSDWCFKYNYANTAKKLILEIKAENESIKSKG